MHFAEDRVQSDIFIREYTDSIIKTNTNEFTSSVVLFDNQSRQDCLPAFFTELSSAHLKECADLNPEIILVGTGKVQQFPPIALFEPLFKKHIGFEIMSTDAACRTFNLLLSEGRAVLAALFL